ncbi:heterotrimeric G protein alpha subunit 4 [Daedaleopsis nitida]|nr:heterotrimeric G protein alpha subunit 4 [Daedaleopsis nitida]
MGAGPSVVLVLGMEGSGKSTLLKRMRMNSGDPFSPEEIEHYRQLIFRNITHGLRSVLYYMASLDLKVSAKDEHLVCLFDDEIPDIIAGQPFPVEYRVALGRLWADPSVQAAYSLDNNAELPENLPYFCAHLERLFEPTYSPNEQDILRAHERTNRLTEVVLKTPVTKLHLVSLGNAMGNRKKWIHHFDNVDAVVYVVDLSSYDACRLEDQSVSVIQDAMAVWDSIVHSRWFENSSLILVLNKNDRFEEKVPHSSIAQYFPDSNCEPGDPTAGREYFERRFARLAQNPNARGKRDVYIHVTSAISDSASHRFVVAAVEGMHILLARLRF